MLILVTYDVATSSEGGTRRLRKVAKECSNFGQRVQNSVFECVVDRMKFEDLKHRLLKIIDKNNDSLRFYFLGNANRHRVEHYGTKEIINVEDTMII